MITAVTFTPDGSAVAVGLLFGQVFFYDCDGLKYITKILCQNRRGVYKDGRKVTGLVFQRNAESATGTTSSNTAATNVPFATNSTASTDNAISRKSVNRTALIASQLLVTTNDCRLRLVNMSDYSVACKYKGVQNESMQIKATFSDDGKYIICGSETGKITIWRAAAECHETAAGVFSMMLSHGKKTGGGGGAGGYSRVSCYEYFTIKSGMARRKSGPGFHGSSSGQKTQEEATICALFAPSAAVSQACADTGLSTHGWLLSSAVIVTATSTGYINVCIKQQDTRPSSEPPSLP